MSRAMSATDDEVFRVIVDRPEKWPTRVYGPYRTLGAAHAAETRETKDYTGKQIEGVVSKVERSPLVWAEV